MALLSESEELRFIRSHLSAAMGHILKGSRSPNSLKIAYAVLQEVVSSVEALQEQVREGYHTNPALVIWPNPKGRQRNPLPGTRIQADECISSRVFELAYQHAADGQDYKHDFSRGVELWTALLGGKRVVVLTRPDGKNLWDDFR